MHCVCSVSLDALKSILRDSRLKWEKWIKIMYTRIDGSRHVSALHPITPCPSTAKIVHLDVSVFCKLEMNSTQKKNTVPTNETVVITGQEMYYTNTNCKMFTWIAVSFRDVSCNKSSLRVIRFKWKKCINIMHSRWCGYRTHQTRVATTMPQLNSMTFPAKVLMLYEYMTYYKIHTLHGNLKISQLNLVLWTIQNRTWT